ncbi:MAG TPA: hypothetical protein PKI12_08970, partial [Bacteroidales bacterium]|nr:hypothetical protein [Bacteroidales bacterium]
MISIVPAVSRKYSEKKGLRVIAYLGLDRPNRRIDYGELLVKRMIESRHTIAGLVIHPSDRLA